MKAWTLIQLNKARLNDLAMCNSKLERDCCNSINNREIRELASQIQTTRKLTPGEQSVLDNI